MTELRHNRKIGFLLLGGCVGLSGGRDVGLGGGRGGAGRPSLYSPIGIPIYLSYINKVYNTV